MEYGLPAGGGSFPLTFSITVPDLSLMSTLNGCGWIQVPQGLATEMYDGDEVALFPLLSVG